MNRLAIALGIATLSTQALAQSTDPELMDRASVIEADLWSRVMGGESRQTQRDIDRIIERMEETRKRYAEQRLQRWLADPYRYEVRTECPPAPKSIWAAMSAAWKPQKSCTMYFVRIAISLEGDDIGTPPERIPGYPPIIKQPN